MILPVHRFIFTAGFSLLFYICTVEALQACPNGWKLINRSGTMYCWGLVDASDSDFNYLSSVAQCSSHNAMGVTIKNAAELALLSEMLNGDSLKKGEAFTCLKRDDPIEPESIEYDRVPKYIETLNKNQKVDLENPTRKGDRLVLNFIRAFQSDDPTGHIFITHPNNKDKYLLKLYFQKTFGGFTYETSDGEVKDEMKTAILEYNDWVIKIVVDLTSDLLRIWQLTPSGLKELASHKFPSNEFLDEMTTVYAQNVVFTNIEHTKGCLSNGLNSWSHSVHPSAYHEREAKAHPTASLPSPYLEQIPLSYFKNENNRARQVYSITTVALKNLNFYLIDGATTNILQSKFVTFFVKFDNGLMSFGQEKLKNKKRSNTGIEFHVRRVNLTAPVGEFEKKNGTRIEVKIEIERDELGLLANVRISDKNGKQLTGEAGYSILFPYVEFTHVLIESEDPVLNAGFSEQTDSKIYETCKFSHFIAQENEDRVPYINSCKLKINALCESIAIQNGTEEDVQVPAGNITVLAVHQIGKKQVYVGSTGIFTTIILLTTLVAIINILASILL